MSTALLRVRLFSFYLSRERVSPRPPPAHLALHPVSRPAAFVLVAYVACTKERGRTRPCHRARAILVVVSDDRGDHGGDSRCMTSHADVSSTHAPPNDISRVPIAKIYRLCFISDSATIWRSRNRRGHFNELAREVDLASQVSLDIPF